MRKSLSLIAATIFVTLLPTAIMAADSAPAAAASAAGVVNINTADAAQLALLPRVGLKTAERIVEFRKTSGAYKKTTDLMQVKGIGDKTFELISPFLTVDGKTTLTESQRAPRKPRAPKAGREQAASETPGQ